MKFACMIAFLVGLAGSAVGQEIETRLIHLRSGAEREWSSFPEDPEDSGLRKMFVSARNEGECCLLLRQQDVKQTWTVLLNGQKLGELVRDENDMTLGLPIPANVLKDQENLISIASANSAKITCDDIRVGQLRLFRRPLQEVLSEATLNLTLTDLTSKEPMPCRFTLMDAQGSLVPLGTVSGNELAVRTGTVYSATGQAHLKVPAGTYTVTAGRGFEYSLATANVTVRAGEVAQLDLSLERQVPTAGYVACDTHVHTLTHSGHGDATIAERMISLAGEGIELPIATDHNIHVDYEPVAKNLKVRRFFTPVIGNEVTTPRGHFNVFPVDTGSRVPDYKQTDWGLLFDDLQRTPGVKVTILNHARDLHSGIRPFGPALHNSATAESLENQPYRFNGMEVINSGATQSDVLQLFQDWMSLLNRGLMVTPVGGSDSHDVARHFVGQGRTYIRCDDRNPGTLDIDTAINSFLQGRVMVSYGLLTKLTVNGKYSSGELAAVPDTEIEVRVEVLGPHWVAADRILLFSNGSVLFDEAIPRIVEESLPKGVQAIRTWKIPRPAHDVHLVAIALGPGIEASSWRTAKPYQPMTQNPVTHVVGCSGAVWIDGDRDGRRLSASDYAERLVAKHGSDAVELVKVLANYDEATAVHTAQRLQAIGFSFEDERFHAALKSSPPPVQAGVMKFRNAWRESELARSSR